MQDPGLSDLDIDQTSSSPPQSSSDDVDYITDRLMEFAPDDIDDIFSSIFAEPPPSPPTITPDSCAPLTYDQFTSAMRFRMDGKVDIVSTETGVLVGTYDIPDTPWDTLRAANSPQLFAVAQRVYSHALLAEFPLLSSDRYKFKDSMLNLNNTLMPALRQRRLDIRRAQDLTYANTGTESAIPVLPFGGRKVLFLNDQLVVGDALGMYITDRLAYHLRDRYTGVIVNYLLKRPSGLARFRSRIAQKIFSAISELAAGRPASAGEQPLLPGYSGVLPAPVTLLTEHDVAVQLSDENLAKFFELRSLIIKRYASLSNSAQQENAVKEMNRTVDTEISKHIPVSAGERGSQQRVFMNSRLLQAKRNYFPAKWPSVIGFPEEADEIRDEWSSRLQNQNHLLRISQEKIIRMEGELKKQYGIVIGPARDFVIRYHGLRNYQFPDNVTNSVPLKELRKMFGLDVDGAGRVAAFDTLVERYYAMDKTRRSRMFENLQSRRTIPNDLLDQLYVIGMPYALKTFSDKLVTVDADAIYSRQYGVYSNTLSARARQIQYLVFLRSSVVSPDVSPGSRDETAIVRLVLEDFYRYAVDSERTPLSVYDSRISEILGDTVSSQTKMMKKKKKKKKRSRIIDEDDEADVGNDSGMATTSSAPPVAVAYPTETNDGHLLLKDNSGNLLQGVVTGNGKLVRMIMTESAYRSASPEHLQHNKQKEIVLVYSKDDEGNTISFFKRSIRGDKLVPVDKLFLRSLLVVRPLPRPMPEITLVPTTSTADVPMPVSFGSSIGARGPTRGNTDTGVNSVAYRTLKEKFDRLNEKFDEASALCKRIYQQLRSSNRDQGFKNMLLGSRDDLLKQAADVIEDLEEKMRWCQEQRRLDEEERQDLMGNFELPPRPSTAPDETLDKSGEDVNEIPSQDSTEDPSVVADDNDDIIPGLQREKSRAEQERADLVKLLRDPTPDTDRVRELWRFLNEPNPQLLAEMNEEYGEPSYSDDGEDTVPEDGQMIQSSTPMFIHGSFYDPVIAAFTQNSMPSMPRPVSMRQLLRSKLRILDRAPLPTETSKERSVGLRISMFVKCAKDEDARYTYIGLFEVGNNDEDSVAGLAIAVDLLDQLDRADGTQVSQVFLYSNIGVVRDIEFIV